MEHPEYLIDTNAVIDFPGERLPLTGMAFMNNIIDAVPNISVITKIELLGFNTSDEHSHTLTNFINDSVVLNLISSVIDKSIDIRKIYKTKLPDTIIAATALVNNLVLITRNIPDFKNIVGNAINKYA